jgi:transcription elongation GreA/GreB family factor
MRKWEFWLCMAALSTAACSVRYASGAAKGAGAERGVDSSMSKAFTREDDDAPAAPVRRRGVEVPVPNFVTARGLAALRAEAERPASEERARELTEHLLTAETVEPADRETVAFGARVTVEGADGRRTYQIVGAIEAAPREGAISWQSPIARALLEARVGDTVVLPRGEVEVVAIEYPD